MRGSHPTTEGLNLSPSRRALIEAMLLAEGSGETLPAADRIPRRGPGPAPLSFAQQRLWFLDQLVPGSAFYNVPVVLKLSAPLDVGSLRRSLDEIVRRHEVLRTCYPATDGQPIQVVRPEGTCPFEVTDLSSLPVEQQNVEAAAIANAEARRAFDLQSGPVIRARVLCLAGGRYWLLLTLHHIVCDGWSMAVLNRELKALYAAFAAGKPSPLEALPIQYADYAVWQRQHLQGSVLEEQLRYWENRLRDLPTLELPTDRPRTSSQDYRGTFRRIPLAQDMGPSLRALAAQEGVTLYMLLLAGFAALLSRYSNQDEIVIGTPIANRTRSEIEGLLGFFVNALVLRLDLSGNPSFREVLRRVRETALEAYSHQDLPFEKLVEKLQPERDLSKNPLFQVGFVLQTAWNIDAGTRQPGTGAEENVDDLHVERGTAIFDLAFHLWESGSAITGGFEYSQALFDESTILRMGGHFETLLERAVSQPDTLLGDLPLMGAHELHRVVVGWNRTSAPFEDECAFHLLFEREAARVPEAPALRWMGRDTSYAALDAEANRLAHVLLGKGLQPGERVALSMERSPEMIAGLLAILKAGAVHVPLDPAYPVERLQSMLRTSGREENEARLALGTGSGPAAEIPGPTRFLLVHGATRPALTAAITDIPDIEILCVDSLRAEIAEASPTKPSIHVGPGALAYVIFTSGSTGVPKGVAIEHRGLCNVAAAQRTLLGTGETDRVLQFASLSFDASIFEICMALSAGATLCLAPRDQLMPGPSLAQFLEEESVSVVTLPPTALAALPRRAFPALRRILVAGEVCPATLVDDWAVGRRFFNLYGPTEATIWSTAVECRAGEGKPSIGRPIPNSTAYILDRHRHPVPVGIVGELHLGGVGLARGYLGRDDLTAERFVEVSLPGLPPQRLYRSGDLARFLPDGNIEFRGRMDHQVKLRGYRIELGEIEEALLRHPSLHETAVLLREDAPGERRLVAYVTRTDETNAASQALERHWSTEQVQHWQRIYEETYGTLTLPADPTFNITGWNSSYTGQPIDPEAMREWVERTVERVRTLRPQRVLEIGCGTGLLLFRIAPHCERYVGTDFAASALDYVRRSIALQNGRFTNVDLVEARADDLEEIRGGPFDLVILNSVVQYFPTAEYLRRTIAHAAAMVAPSGALFIGDVRNLAQLEAFALSVEWTRSEPGTSVASLRERAQHRMALEQELTLDPGFFRALPRDIPSISGVEILLKRGRHATELTRFRYDVLLHCGVAPRAVPPTARVAWKGAPSLATILDDIRRRRPDEVCLTNVPNARVAESLHLRSRVMSADAPETIGNIQAEFPASDATGVDPEDLVRMAEEAGYGVEFHVSETAPAMAFDAVFVRQEARDALGGRVPLPRPFIAQQDFQAWRQFGNNPLQGRFLQNLVPILRKHLERQLPAHAIPSQFVMLESLPRTPSGKVDRGRLPSPEKARPSLGVEFIPPASQVERILEEVWSSVLGVSPVGIRDNFFELGGDSILGIQIVARARDAGVIVQPRDLFEHQTIQELALVCPLASARSGSDELRKAQSQVNGASNGDSEGGTAFPQARLSSDDLARLMKRIGGTREKNPTT